MKKAQLILQDEDIFWVGLALPEKSLWYKGIVQKFTGIYIEKADKGFNVVCSDGHRLHIINVIDKVMPVGFWKHSNKGLLKSNIGKEISIEEHTEEFPNYKKIMPDKERMKQLGTYSSGVGYDLTEFVYMLFNYGIKIRLEFLEDLYSLKNAKWSVYIKDNRSAILFESDRHTAVIMPRMPEKVEHFI